MSRANVLLTITDGEDNRDEKNRNFEKAIKKLNRNGVFSLSVGIGKTDVDHEGLSIIADETDGKHIAPFNSLGVASALSDITEIIHTRIARQVLMSNTTYEERLEIERNNLRAAINLFILIDCSYSMVGLTSDDRWDGDSDKLYNTKHSAINVLRTLNPHHDKVAVAKFWEKYKLLARFNQNFQRSAEIIADIDPDNGTGLYRAICFATEEF